MAAFRDAVAVVGGLKVGGFAAIPRHPGDGWGGVVALPDEALGPGLRRGDGNARFGIDC
jgi:hypothetical protein